MQRGPRTQMTIILGQFSRHWERTERERDKDLCLMTRGAKDGKVALEH